jgi:hypothetical protein
VKHIYNYFLLKVSNKYPLQGYIERYEITFREYLHPSYESNYFNGSLDHLTTSSTGYPESPRHAKGPLGSPGYPSKTSKFTAVYGHYFIVPAIH